jgi:hypothetical protein
MAERSLSFMGTGVGVAVAVGVSVKVGMIMGVRVAVRNGVLVVSAVAVSVGADRDFSPAAQPDRIRYTARRSEHLQHRRKST